MDGNEQKTYDFLSSLGIAYTRVEHAPAATMADCETVDEKLGVRMCKNLFLCNRQKTAFYLLLMPGDKPFRTKELSAQIATARLSFAGEAEMESLLGLHPGAVSVMGLINDTDGRVQLLIDEELQKPEYFGCHPCVNTASLRLRTADVFGPFLRATGHHPLFVRLSREESGVGPQD